MMQAIEQMTANSEVNLSPDIIRALQNILTQSRVIIPDLETPYSRFPNRSRSTIETKGQSISAILIERQQQLDAVLQNISGLEAVMNRVKSLHQQLLDGQDEIIHSIILHRGHISALWRLPVEVLSQIFVHCLPKTDHLRVSSMLAPMLLTRICRHWRDVAMDMPSLWCRLSMEVADWSTRDFQQIAFCYHSWLERSRERPLSFAIEHLPSGAPMLQILLEPYNTRISSLQITYTDDNVEPELLFQDLPALHKLTLDWRGNYMDGSIIARSISRLPSTLRNLTVLGCFVGPLELQRFASPNGWVHMTSIDIALHEPHEFLHLLRLCPNLSSLRILLHPRDNVLQNLEPLRHTRLQSLSISYTILWHVRDPLPALLNALTLPNLRVLETRCVPGSMWPHEPFRAFLTRSNCPLESLTLGVGLPTTDSERAGYIDLIPSLEVTMDSRPDNHLGGGARHPAQGLPGGLFGMAFRSSS
ncbi:hypothetical protein K503DRAFT_724653 [Rhizopogon vinicolor AM-OR11-026]|uniref:F-box domain-containing protein n=1 Tax=Rhizopogon vinicolor AM-OR11-026 TaxID=1314800 RepID=A0A1B7MP10_9AGAM|nr:hypothetical protein K503DRAFT_724653 [Rhizopogon vinicolor AM-OR11-026]